jgi:ParB/RepB/Spo0J family partition protein
MHDTLKPVGWFKLKPQVRKQFDEASLRRLGESLKGKQLQPVGAQPDGTVIYGERRVRAAMLVGIEALEVKIIDEPLSDSRIKTLQLIENLQREDLSDYDKWIACTDLMAMHADWQQKDLTEHLNLEQSWSTRLLSPSKCIGSVQDALKEGKVSLSDCYALSKVPPEKQRALLALRLSGATRDALERAGRAVRNGGEKQSAVSVRRVTCLLSSGISIVVSGKEITIDNIIEALSEAGKEARKARDQGQDAKTLAAILKNKAKAKAVPTG